MFVALKFPDCLTDGSSPAKANNFFGEPKRLISPISLIMIAPSQMPIPGIEQIGESSCYWICLYRANQFVFGAFGFARLTF